jgi:hypothetical protein
MKASRNQFEGIKTHGALATNLALGFTMLSPLTVLIIVFLGARFFAQLNG